MKRTVAQIMAEIRTTVSTSGGVRRLAGIDPVTGIGFSYTEYAYGVWIGKDVMIDVRNHNGSSTLEAERDQVVPLVARWIADNT